MHWSKAIKKVELASAISTEIHHFKKVDCKIVANLDASVLPTKEILSISFLKWNFSPENLALPSNISDAMHITYIAYAVFMNYL